MTDATTDAAAAEGGLRKRITVWGIVALGAGCAIGASIFSVIAPSAALAGPAMLMTLAVAMIPMIIFAVIYSFMGSAAPTTGASYEWTRRFVHPFAGFMVAWLRIVGSTAALVILAQVLVQYVSMAFPLPLKATMGAIFTLLFLINIVGVTATARLQTLMLVVLVAALLILTAFSAPSLDAASFTPFFSEGWGGALAAVPLLVGLFFGLEAATEVGGEIKSAQRAIPVGIAIAVVLTAILYLLVSASALGVLGAERLGQSDAPLLELAQETLGAAGTPFILTAAVVALGTSLNAIFVIFSRFLFAMSRAGVFPAALSRTHAKTGAPHIAIAVIYVLCLLGLFMPTGLIFLFLAVNIPTLLKYGATCLSATRLIRRHPDLYETAYFKPGRRAVLIWGWAGVICALAIILAGLQADWRPYAALLVWLMIGAAYYAIRRRSRAV